VKELESGGPHRRGLAWNQIKTLYRYELRSAFREKTIVINSILIPIFLYPMIMWAAFSGLMFVEGQSDRLDSRVALRNLPREHPGLLAKMERNRKIQIIPDDHDPVAAKIRKSKLDAAVEFLPLRDDDSKLEGNFKVQLTFNGSKERSLKARERVEAIIDDYRKEWLKREANKRGISAEEWKGIAVTTQNVASEKQMGGFILGLMLPMLFVVMVAMGCFYPAIDCTAGERERNTWETLMTSAASRVNIVVAKYLYVTTLGGLAGALNLLAFAITLKPIFAPLLAKAGTSLNFSVPLSALPLLVVAAMLLAGFVSAGMMIFASFARTFKEGQSMIMPFYMLVLIPPMFLQTPGIAFSLPLACIPVINVTMMVRSLVAGTFPWLPILITILTSLGAIAGCIRVAAFILKFEEIMIQSDKAGVKRFLQQRVFRRHKSAGPQLERQP
jgi:sodium transport system permease protein